MADEQGHQEGDTPKEVYETIDGTPLEGTFREVFPQMNRGWWKSGFRRRP